MGEPAHRDPEWLRERYWDEGMSLREIASKAGVSVTTVAGHMERHGIERRSSADQDPLPMPDWVDMDDEEWGALSVRGRRHHRVAVPVMRRLARWKVERGCNRCGYSRYSGALVFHHKDPDEKTAKVSSLASSSCPWETVMEEADKCELLCMNCHQEEHSGSFGVATATGEGEEVVSLG